MRALVPVPPGETREYVTRMHRADGSWRWLASSVAEPHSTSPAMRAFVSNFRDITRRVEAENALQDAKRRLEFLLSANAAVTYSVLPTPAASARRSSARTCATCWAGTRRLLRAPGSGSRTFTRTIAAEVDAGIVEMYATGARNFEYRFPHADGGYRWLHDSVRLVRDADGTPFELIGHFTDISVRRNAEESLRAPRPISGC